ncbi:hypothetical protein M1B72_17050 [Geomonas paludis]|uniref:Uncharacterized protein n=1 Tax=Geomonas paludis TaxID=2740185 RepID=A0A6V8MZ10_9BACT|nr:hypothetical protein [Geomonas paludis]UPU35144.1 hypothetical protein M1B72_17050 [Geomonas paludis]GFO65466.1 hypothetical protein GMPD_33850 [Geomonas paludis]
MEPIVATQWMTAIFFFCLELIILYLIVKGKIDLRMLISEDNGNASMARFQLLIFTFVISMSLFIVIISKKDGPGFPVEIPAGILSLLGISGGSYVLGKGIQAMKDVSAARQAEDTGGSAAPGESGGVAPGGTATATVTATPATATVPAAAPAMATRMMTDDGSVG